MNNKKIYGVGIAAILIIAAFFIISNILGKDSNQDISYNIENIKMPEGLSDQVGGLGFMPDGKLVACFHRGEVMTYDPDTKKWKLFAHGLHDPLGLLVVNNSEVLVMQRPELTRLKDTDADGKADIYKNVTDDFGMSGNYHEFAFTPVKDKKGNIYFSLNTASSGGGIRSKVRGKLNLMGRDGKSGRSQMFSVVPYRGWIMKVTQEGKVRPYASGLRSPNGLGFDPEGNLFATDNQGDWVGTSKLYNIKKGHFYGHPASLVWRKNWGNKSPFNMPLSYLDSLRTKAAVLFPQGIMANSPSQPVFDNTNGKFGPFTGQLFVGEMNRKRILRVMLEKVGGVFQGSVIPFIDGNGLSIGNNRLAFGPDGSLWAGKTQHGWAGDKGIQRITYAGKSPFDIYDMRLTKNGFDLVFTQPVDLSAVRDTSNYQFRRYYYSYQKRDTTKPVDLAVQKDIHPVPIKDVKISSNQKRVSLQLGKLKEGYIYELKLGPIKSNDDNQKLAHQLICYTLKRLKKE